ncbi:MAG: UDP-N-acetylmuramoyl-tripeptide--D-alanyl-D-alanine ligase [Candidatus Midichloria sp.]|nr:MAG: UDP-N-acetylmuramoyl-tripeptide--D-alanyl-D-alanine ligase [Candidatus Midichloria sp.]
MVNNFIWNQDKLKSALRLKHCSGFQSNNISIDSREVKEGDIFMGLKGLHHDGGVFAEKALENGAAICIINHSVGIENSRIITVDDTEKALVELALFRRANFPQRSRLIGITGSTGKTSTKEQAKLVLQNFGNAYATIGNLNNHLGLPLTIANVPNDVDYCILEMGMSHAGEISYLSKIAKPDISIITTIAPAHLKFFDSIEDIVRVKSEIYQGMKAGSWAVINEDSPYKSIMVAEAEKYNLNIITFGKSKNADLSLSEYKIEQNKTKIKAYYQGQTISYFFPVIAGKHLVLNSLAALAVTTVLNHDLERSSNGLAAFKPICSRGAAQILKNNIILIDDTYNANPTSVRAALEAIIQYRASNNRLIAILGDMRELGDGAKQLHEDLADSAVKLDVIHTVGDLMEALYENISKEKRGNHTRSAEEMSNFIINQIKENDIILVKGSLSMNMSKIVNAILKDFSQ